MNIEQIIKIVSGFKGCTFASIDAETREGGIFRHVKNERVMLFTNSNSSGYENLVRRRLAEIGKDPQSFHVGDLAWGERISDSPLIYHKGFYYLQTILTHPGEVRYFTATGREMPKEMAESILKRPSNNQGLPDDRRVIVKSYAVDNIKAIRMLKKKLSIKT